MNEAYVHVCTCPLSHKQVTIVCPGPSDLATCGSGGKREEGRWEQKEKNLTRASNYNNKIIMLYSEKAELACIECTYAHSISCVSILCVYIYNYIYVCVPIYYVYILYVLYIIELTSTAATTLSPDEAPTKNPSS